MDKNKNLAIQEIFGRAVKNHQEGKTDIAQDLYNQILKINPNYSDAHNNLGLIFKDLKEHQKAKECFEKAISIDPSYVKAHYNLGIVFKELGEHQKAKDCYEKTIQIDSGNEQAYNNLGNTYTDLGEYQNAKTVYEKAIELKPDYAQAHNNLGVILKKLNRLEEAEVSLRKSIIFNTDFIEVTKSINKGDWQNSKYLLEKMSTIKIIDMSRSVTEFIRIWCIYCHQLLIQGDIKRLTKILTKLLIIGERNQNINNLINSYFDTVDIIKALELVELNDKVLIKVGYCQYKFSTRDYVLSESLAILNIKEASKLIANPETADLGWLIVRRSLALCKNRNIAREALNSLTTNLELTK